MSFQDKLLHEDGLVFMSMNCGLLIGILLELVLSQDYKNIVMGTIITCLLFMFLGIYMFIKYQYKRK